MLSFSSVGDELADVGADVGAKDEDGDGSDGAKVGVSSRETSSFSCDFDA